MARAAVKAKQQARAQAQPAKAARGGRKRGGSGGNPNQDLFFVRLRRGQKWIYAALALIFAATFAGVGVGSGSGGLSDLYTGIFGGGSNSVSKAQNEINTDPAKGYRDLANAYIAKNDIPGAIGALQSYTAVKKKDAGGWAQLAGLEQQQGDAYATQYQQAQQAAQLAAPGQSLQPTGTLGQALGTNPVDQYYSQQATSVTTQLYQQATSAYSAALQDYQKAAALQPHSAEAQFLVATSAERAGQYAVAVAAFKRYLVLDPNSPQAPQVKQAIKQLEAAIAPPKPKPKK